VGLEEEGEFVDSLSAERTADSETAFVDAGSSFAVVVAVGVDSSAILVVWSH